MTTVILKPDEPVEVAIRRFRRAIERTGLIPELRTRTAYEKPTAERKRKKAAAVARLRKQIKRSLPPKKRYCLGIAGAAMPKRPSNVQPGVSRNR